MLRIVNNAGMVLDLPANAVISVERNNPLFNDPGDFFQDVSYAITAPFTDNNKLFFSRGDLIESTTDYYLLPAKFYADGTQMVAGNIRYRIGTNGFEANLEPNYAAINSLLTGIRMPEILTLDADYSMFSDPDAFEAMMLDTAQSPEKYPYIFFPVQNPNFVPHTIKLPPPGHPVDDPVDTPVFNPGFVNAFDVPTERFIARQSEADFLFGVSPYWKVSYIIEKIAEYLSFATDGGLVFNDDIKNLCIYTRVSLGKTVILPSMQYMPNILISDFLKFLRERLHLSLDFDLRTGILAVESFKSIVNSGDIIDLTPFVTTTIEQEVPDAQSLTVTLKVDQADKTFLVVDEGGNDTYPPTSSLVADTGDTKLELDCGTTKGFAGSETTAPHPSVDQTCVHDAWGRVDPGVQFLPPDISYTDASDPTTLNNWPLRIFKYLGYQAVTGGFSPAAEPYDLNDDDIDFYRFTNDSKRLIITAEMPPLVLSEMKVTSKYTHRTAGMNYTKYIIEKMVYDARDKTEIIDTKIYSRTLNYRIDTKVAIIPFQSVVSPEDAENISTRIKAYFDPLIHGISQVQLTILNSSDDILPSDPITIPTNTQGTGGVAVPIYGVGPLGASKLRIYQGQPRYAIYAGTKIPFTQHDGYWEMNLNARPAFTILVNTYVIFF